MHCTEPESSFRPSPPFPNKDSIRCPSLDLFGAAVSCESSCGEDFSDHSFCSSRGSQSQCCHHDAVVFQNFQAWKKPTKIPQRLVQEEDLIGRLDECISDANSDSSTVDCTLSLRTPATGHSITNPATFVSVEPALNMATTLSGDHPPINQFKGTSESILPKWIISSSSPSPSNNISCLPLDSRGSFVSAKETLGRNYMSFFKHQRLIQKSGLRISENAGSVGRKCANCDTATTPLWRNGPKGPKSLCNACGIRFKKEERRAATVMAAGDQYHQTRRSRNNEDRDLIFEKAHSYNDISRESSCLTWQGSLSSIHETPTKNIIIQLQGQKPTLMESSIYNRILQPNSAAVNNNNVGLEQGEGAGPALLLGLSMDGAFGSQKRQ